MTTNTSTLWDDTHDQFYRLDKEGKRIPVASKCSLAQTDEDTKPQEVTKPKLLPMKEVQEQPTPEPNEQPPTRRIYTSDDILTAVVNRLGVSLELMQSKTRVYRVADPRTLSMFLLREDGGLSFPRIGQIFNRDHTTVMHGYQRISRQSASDKALAGTIERVRSVYLRQVPTRRPPTRSAILLAVATETAREPSSGWELSQRTLTHETALYLLREDGMFSVEDVGTLMGISAGEVVEIDYRFQIDVARNEDFKNLVARVRQHYWPQPEAS